MAKKKENKKESQNTTPEININGSEKYVGNVKIRVVRNGHILNDITKHNEGNYPLFSFLVACLNSTFDINGVPNYIGLLYNKEGSTPKLLHSVSIPKSSRFVSKKRIENTSTEVPQVNYQFTIPASYLFTSSEYLNDDGLVEINRLQLYNSYAGNINNINNYCAQIDLDSDNSIKLNPSDIQKYTIFVTWSLYITN